MTFVDWLDAQPGSDAATARRLGISKQRLALYRHQRCLPRPAELIRLMRLTGLTIDAFYRPFHQDAIRRHRSTKLALPQPNQGQRAAMRAQRNRKGHNHHGG